MKMFTATMLLVVSASLAGCAMPQNQMQEQIKTNLELSRLKAKIHRNQLAILAVNKKVNALKSLVEGPGS
ncbi:hypothetical protein HAQ00_02355 [Acidithiobacillus caldus ATCC 51756]|jgi:hypothetical protein|uniref:hypothetical protein n=1 Tax=Acidithiobacillus caldus TaxID=33059 RepID=UPI001C0673BD|nr:hypothetical protein [Acidithiobacillus caldus]MBU2734587.1 hypothetical protein [Acidithiobacillus caldus ATCC 51756]MBU2801332.1 hypothetical protein [Acidithiobacillus caldus]